MAIADAFNSKRRFPGAPSPGGELKTEALYSKGLPANRPGGRFERKHRITEGGSFDENPNVQAAAIANLPGRGLSASAPPSIAMAPSSLAGANIPSLGVPAAPGASPLAAPFQRQTRPVAPQAATLSGSGDIDELLKLIG